MLGNGRLEAMCFDGEKRLAHIRGKMRKKVSIRAVDSRRLSESIVLGVDQPGRHRTPFFARLPG
jgi:hypothetical protein